MLLTRAYRGTHQERTELLSCITDVQPARVGEDAEVRLEQRKRLINYLPKFGIAIPDYGIMVATANKLLSIFDSDPKFALDKALFVRDHKVDSIQYNDEELFNRYIDYLQGLVRVAGGTNSHSKQGSAFA